MNYLPVQESQFVMLALSCISAIINCCFFSAEHWFRLSLIRAINSYLKK